MGQFHRLTKCANVTRFDYPANAQWAVADVDANGIHIPPVL
jgi:hypothetical protein